MGTEVYVHILCIFMVMVSRVRVSNRVGVRLVIAAHRLIAQWIVPAHPLTVVSALCDLFTFRY